MKKYEAQNIPAPKKGLINHPPMQPEHVYMLAQTVLRVKPPRWSLRIE